ncbi:siroheme synthase CysG [uncultured Litoreibacter sp.]|uniref:siroheme synthase CysG n=1 Tax=uncultured Litoreibacter sp. TaxID=1392394 RepID=UPI00261FB96A|nr:siroheme synthase CysG [uncultured Litoreibacter sp.]
MKHFPIFMALTGQSVIVSGGGEAALAKLRLLLKTEAALKVFATDPAPEIVAWAREARLTLTRRAVQTGDAQGARLFYAANEDDAEDARVAELAEREGALVNIVDNLNDSQFITPAMVDRDPVVVAIGTEGAAPVLARAIKKDIEERLSPRLGLMARIGKAFRAKADALPFGVKRREFWADYYAQDIASEDEANGALNALLDQHLSAQTKEGHVDLVGAGPGDPELLTLKARKALDEADVVIYDRLVAPEILELARREAIMLSAGKEGFGPSMTQDAINEMIVTHARGGAHVVRLKSGDPTVFGRLDEELEACDASGVAWNIVPGITSASAAVAALGQSFTKRGRNSGVRFITGHDTKGFADHDWKTLAREGEVAAIYMGKKSARFIQGRLLMHGADALTQVTVIENASRPEQRILATTLGELEPTLTHAKLSGPALVFLGLAPRAALNAAQQHEMEAAI